MNTSNATTKNILQQLVRIPSITGSEQAAREVITCVTALLAHTGAVMHHGVINGYPYLLASTRRPDKNTIWFVCHLDVVPADEDMFTVTSDAANYYGRGVFDMKGMAAATLTAFLHLANPASANVGLMFTTDEETGGRNGVGKLADKNFKAAATFVFDQSDDWVMQEKMKGVLWLEVTATGKNAHGARPWLGNSANEAMIGYLSNLKRWYELSIPKDDPDKYYTTFNIGTLHGGQATNQVNDKTVATVDVRFVSEAEAAKVIKAAHSVAKQYPGIHLKELLHEPCVESDFSEFWFQKTMQFMRELGLKPGGEGERYGHGSTDGRYFAPLSIPIISTRPAGGGQHSPEEWASKKGLAELEQLVALLMAETAKAVNLPHNRA